MGQNAAEATCGVDSANQKAMASHGAASFYERENHLDPSEKLLYDLIAPAAKRKPVLDIGVGGGRTIPALTAISDDYTAVDYSPTMVERLTTRYPKLRLLQADARDMSMLGNESFYLVVFSCAGIDMVNHVDRARIYAKCGASCDPMALSSFRPTTGTFASGSPIRAFCR